SYVLPTASSVLLLHAAEGVSGQFDEWKTQGLFLEGALRYTAQDVYFDATRISVASAMTAAGIAGPVELASAENLDRAFEHADRFARLPPSALNPAQQRFLDSAASIQHIRDRDQALRTLDSLGGRVHALTPEALGHQASAHARQLDARLDRLTPVTAGAWTAPIEYRSQGTGGTGLVGGRDAWFGPRWLVGGSVAFGSSWMQFGSLGGQADGPSSSANLYAHYRDAGGRWYATGMAGMTDASLWIQRGIDLGDAGVHEAYSQRRIGQSYMQGEVGRRLGIAGGRLSPFVGLDYAWSRDDGFAEQGETGLELIADPTSAALLNGSVGARYARDWRLGASGWLQFDLDARYRHRLADHGTTPRAAFAAIPEVRFDLPAWPQQQDSGSVSLGLLAGFGEWTGTLDHTRQLSADVPDAGWWLGLQRQF
ncbi:MAG TPA: autotransporter outer membrane beta-barrel domain-containing protein, partial [Lysobacter sp.]